MCSNVLCTDKEKYGINGISQPFANNFQSIFLQKIRLWSKNSIHYSHIFSYQLIRSIWSGSGPATYTTLRVKMYILRFVLNISTNTWKRLILLLIAEIFCLILLDDWRFIQFEVQAEINSNVVVAEWLRRQTRNLLGNSRAGSNPADYVMQIFGGTTRWDEILFSRWWLLNV